MCLHQFSSFNKYILVRRRLKQFVVSITHKTSAFQALVPSQTRVQYFFGKEVVLTLAVHCKFEKKSNLIDRSKAVVFWNSCADANLDENHHPFLIACRT